MVRHHGALLLLGLAAQMCLTALAATPLFVDVALRGRQVSSGRPSRLATLAKKRRKRKDRVVEDAPADDALAKDDGLVLLRDSGGGGSWDGGATVEELVRQRVADVERCLTLRGRDDRRRNNFNGEQDFFISCSSSSAVFREPMWTSTAAQLDMG